MLEKVCIGTAGLGGLEYGRNKRTVWKSDAIKILTHAREAGITHFDTSPSYCFAEEILGELFRNDDKVTIFSKSDGSRDTAIASVKTLGRPVLMKHNWDKNFPSYPAWAQGVSVYQEDAFAAGGYGFEWIQTPWSILTQYPVPSYGNVMLRSVLCQGILAGDPCPPGIDLTQAKEVAELLGMDLMQFAIKAALDHPRAKLVCFGPTTMNELYALINWATLETRSVYPYVGLVEPQFIDPRQFR